MLRRYKIDSLAMAQPVIGFTQSAAACYAAHNIRMHVLAPGLVETPMARRAAAAERILKFIATKQPRSAPPIALSSQSLLHESC